MQNGCAGVPESSTGNGRSIRSGKGKHRRSSQPGCSFSYHSDPDNDLVPKRSRNSAPGRHDARAADSKIYRTSTAIKTIAADTASVFGKSVVRITIQPAFSRLRGSDDRMFSSMRVFAGVPVWRTVAAQCNAACLTRPKMNPKRPDLYAFCTFADLRLHDRSNCIEMRTAAISHDA